MRRAGRFDSEIVIPVPSKEARIEILTIMTRNMRLAADVDLQAIADVTHGYVGADLHNLCKKAAVSLFYVPRYIFACDRVLPAHN